MSEVETVEHLFCQCKCVDMLWKSIRENYLLQFGIHYLSNQDILLGLCIGPEMDCFVNHIVLLAKWHIHKCRIVGTKPSKIEFESLLKSTISIEKCIAIKRKKESVWARKWQFVPN
jgi:hypothetical protein